MGTVHRPNFRDALRRVAMVLQQHAVKIGRRFENLDGREDRLFTRAMLDEFAEDNFSSPRYTCTMVRVPVSMPGAPLCMKKIERVYEVPSAAEIFDFMHRLFRTVQLSSECSIVCLIYVERLMENAKVPLTSTTWRPIVMCGLLLASKVWQDLSSWNIEFATVFPQFSLDAINKLEALFLRSVKWDLYISGGLYAKYYFALRSLTEKTDFRHRYNRLVNVDAPSAARVQQRTTAIKEEALLQLSRSMY